MFTKKETVIEKKLENKPSFKNLLNIEKEKVPESRSKSKSKSNVKKKLKKKVSAISPPKSTTSIGRYTSERQIQNIQENKSTQYERSPSQKSLRRTRKNEGNQIMKKIINMKNKVMILEGSLNEMHTRQKEIQNLKKQSSRQISVKDRDQQNMEKLRTVYEFLGDYEIEIKRQTGQIKSSYISKIEEQFHSSENINISNLDKGIESKNYKPPQAGMPRLEQKLSKLNKLFM